MSEKIKIQTPKRGLVDFPTLAVILIMALGMPLAAVLQHKGMLHPVLTVMICSILMNASFTAWHEPSHGNFSKHKWINNLAGFVASLASVYPGYFARKREHLIHHKYEGQEGKDPVYLRIQETGFLLFPLRLFIVNFLQRKPLDVPDSFCKITKAQKISDMASNLLALLIVVLSFVFGYGLEVTCAWILPRFIIFWLHAYYICFFPHHIDEGGYEKYRVRKLGFLARFITMEQNYHGIHHKWPFFPWYMYKRILKDHSDSFNENNIEIIGN